MKTTEDLFRKMPEPFASMAINNCTKRQLKISYDTTSDALLFSFSWNETQEGDDFWDAVNYELEYLKK